MPPCHSMTTSPSNQNHLVARVYLSAAFSKRRDTLRLAAELTSLGYEVASTWQRDHMPVEDEKSAGALAARNVMALLKSDVLIVVGSKMSRRVTWEMGFARAAGLRILRVGIKERYHIYDALPHESYASESELTQALHKISLLRFKKGIERERKIGRGRVLDD